MPSLLITVFIATWVLTALLRRYALAKSLLDVPNARSSHQLPTPRGGGVAFVLSFTLALGWLWWEGQLEATATVALLGGAGLIAVIGFMDDHGHIAARWRLLGHFVAAGWGLAWLGGLAPVELMGQVIDFGVAGWVLGALYCVWLLNLYNFMDGIDGIASIEAISVCLGAALLFGLHGDVSRIALPLLLGASVAGFLLWNFPPAKIFMGDAGSGFLGMVLALFSLRDAWAAPHNLWVWVILLGVFVVDATFTLCRRLARREKVYQAHRSHAYQHAARHHRGHLPVTLAVAAINVFWLLPMAYWVVHGLGGVLGMAIAYAPLVALAVWYHAGKPETLAQH